MTNNPKHVVTGSARISFEHLFKPYARDEKQEAKYSVTILVPKTDISTKARIDAAIKAAAEEGITKCFGGTRPPILAIPVHDGDGVRPSDGMPFGAECKGMWVFTASSKSAPGVVDLQLNPIINQSDVYSGCYCRVSVDFFPYNSNGRKGIGCGLANVQKIADGEPLGGGTTAEEDFGAAQPQQIQPQQAYTYAPQTTADPLAGILY